MAGRGRMGKGEVNGVVRTIDARITVDRLEPLLVAP